MRKYGFESIQCVKYCKSITKDKELAQELYQHVCLKILERWDRYNPESRNTIPFFKVVAKTELFDKNSEFNKMVKQKTVECDAEPEPNQLLEFIHQFINQPTDDRELFAKNRILSVYLKTGSSLKAGLIIGISKDIVLKVSHEHLNLIKNKYDQLLDNDIPNPVHGVLLD